MALHEENQLAKDIEYLRDAYEYALEFSRDNSTQCGAVLLNKHGSVIGRGANHFPRRVKESEARWQRPLKYQFVEHDERNAIFDAAWNGFSTAYSTLYAPWFACADCARAIIQAGIVEVVGQALPEHLEPEVLARWQQSCEAGDTMLTEAGVILRRIEVKLGN